MKDNIPRISSMIDAHMSVSISDMYALYLIAFLFSGVKERERINKQTLCLNSKNETSLKRFVVQGLGRGQATNLSHADKTAEK